MMDGIAIADGLSAAAENDGQDEEPLEGTAMFAQLQVRLLC